MKTPLSFKKSIKICLLACLSVLSVCLFSCKKDEIVSEKKVKGEAKIKIVNASPSSANVDFYIDTSKVNNAGLQFGKDQDYVKIYSGQVSTAVAKDGVISVTSDFTFVPTLSYTSFYVEDRTGSGSILTLEDNFGAMQPGMARVRFVNLTPWLTNSININTSGNELIVGALGFKETSANFLFNPDVDLRISVIGSGTVKTLSANEFEAGKIYTVWLSGTSNSTLTVNKMTYN